MKVFEEVPPIAHHLLIWEGAFSPRNAHFNVGFVVEELEAELFQKFVVVEEVLERMEVDVWVAFL